MNLVAMSHWVYTDANFLLLYFSGLISFLCSWFWQSPTYGSWNWVGPCLCPLCLPHTGLGGSRGESHFGSVTPATEIWGLAGVVDAIIQEVGSTGDGGDAPMGTHATAELLQHSAL